ncbi:MAG: response regulator [Pseudomonadota bacterium]|jgi:two-component system chemotaxis response regulator CheY
MTKLVLIVDDCSSSRQAVSFLLKEMGCRPIEACDGNEALVELEKNRVHLIVSDLYMPNMDGIAFAREVRKRPTSKFTPIIMLTTEVREAKKQEGRSAGVTAWVVKPFDSSELADLVSKLVMLPRQTEGASGA